MLGSVPPMFKASENPVTTASPLPTLIVKNTNCLLWHTYCHSLERILGTDNTAIHKTQSAFKM